MQCFSASFHRHVKKILKLLTFRDSAGFTQRLDGANHGIREVHGKAKEPGANLILEEETHGFLMLVLEVDRPADQLQPLPQRGTRTVRAMNASAQH